MIPQSILRHLLVLLVVAVAAASCGSAERPTLGDEPTDAADSEDEQIDSEDEQVLTEDDQVATEQLHPDVVEVNFGREGQGPYTFDVTISSPYDTPERYADAWRVVGADGTVYGTRELTHDHQGEQPFTRSLNGVEIPEDVIDLVVEARDSVNGWGGGTVDIKVDRGS